MRNYLRIAVLTVLAGLAMASAHAQTTPGDTDLDGEVTAVDRALVVDHILGRSALTGDALANADLNADTKVDAADLILYRDLLFFFASADVVSRMVSVYNAAQPAESVATSRALAAFNEPGMGIALMTPDGSNVFGFGDRILVGTRGFGMGAVQSVSVTLSGDPIPVAIFGDYFVIQAPPTTGEFILEVDLVLTSGETVREMLSFSVMNSAVSRGVSVFNLAASPTVTGVSRAVAAFNERGMPIELMSPDGSNVFPFGDAILVSLRGFDPAAIELVRVELNGTEIEVAMLGDYIVLAPPPSTGEFMLLVEISLAGGQTETEMLTFAVMNSAVSRAVSAVNVGQLIDGPTVSRTVSLMNARSDPESKAISRAVSVENAEAKGTLLEEENEQ